MLILLNNEFVDDQTACLSIWEAGLLYGYGVYETMRTFNGKLKLLDQHLSRLKDSATALSISMPYEEKVLSSKLDELIRRREVEEPNCDFRVRITLTAGTADGRAKISGQPTLLITAAKLAVPPTTPLTLQSFQMTRLLPAAKTTANLPAILAEHNAAVKNADEGLLVDEKNNVHEGSFCNIFLIKDGVLQYPKSDALNGITQDLLLSLTAQLLPAEQKVLTLQDFYAADEVFTSGSIRGVRPVKQIDGHTIAAPGPYTRQIQALYAKWVRE